MNKTFTLNYTLFLLSFFWYSSFFSSAYGQNLSWLNHYQGNSTIEVRAIDYDSIGFVYVGGVFRDTFFYDPEDLSKWTVSNRRNSFAMSSDNFIQKLDSNGKILWTKWFGSIENDNIQGIKISKNGHLYAYGIFQRTVDFDLDTTVYEMTSAGGGDAFIAKYNLDGNILWAKSFKGLSTVAAYDLDVDENDQVYVTGMHIGLANFNTDSSGSDTFTSKGFNDLYIAKLNDTGKLDWVHSYGSYPGQFMRNNGHSVSYDGFGGIWVAGKFRDSLYINMQGKNFIASRRRNSDDGLIFKFNKAGDLLYAEAITTNSGAGTTSQVINDEEGNAYICGYGRGDIDFDTNSIGTRYGNEDPYLFKLDSNFNFQWGLSISNSRNSRAFSIALNGEGINMVGWFRDDSAQVDPLGGGRFIQPVSTNNNAFILTYDPANGELRNAQVYAASGETRPNSIKTRKNNFIIGGNFSASGNFNPGQGIDSLFSRRNSTDGYIQNFNNCPSSFFVTDTAVCDSFFWTVDSTWYAASTIKTITSVNSKGCDSLISLRLTINEKNFTTDTVFACDSFTWINENTYFMNNDTANFILPNQFGCDSLVSLFLTISNSFNIIDTIQACDSFTWIDGITYFQSNDTAVYIFQTQSGCDSIVNLNLQINETTNFIDNVTACDSFTWINGITYFANNNSATHTVQNHLGCDSIITLDLTINQSSTFTDFVTACDSFTWMDGNTYFANNNSATHTVQNHLGCDSIITLDLTLNQTSTFTDFVTACDSFTWMDGNTYFANNNSATHIIQNHLGCDSIITLNLTINQSSTFTDEVIACNSYTWIDGNSYSESNNTATHTISNHLGCDSIITLDLEIITIDTSVIINNGTLIASVNKTNYQWLNCEDNFSPIIGENTAQFKPDETGIFAVEITQQICVDTSRCIPLEVLNINSKITQNGLNIYPNPTRDKITIEIGFSASASVKIYDVFGKLSANYHISNSQDITLPDVSGVYLICVKTENGEFCKRVVKF